MERFIYYRGEEYGEGCANKPDRIPIRSSSQWLDKNKNGRYLFLYFATVYRFAVLLLSANKEKTGSLFF